MAINCYSVQDGNWSQTSTWNCGKVPNLNDTTETLHVVYVYEDSQTINNSYQVGGVVQIHDATLQFVFGESQPWSPPPEIEHIFRERKDWVAALLMIGYTLGSIIILI